MAIGDYDPSKLPGLTTTVGSAGAITGGAVQDFVYVCPKCGSPSVKYHELVGSDAACESCSWSGSHGELVGARFSHEFVGGREEIVQRMMNDLRTTIAQSSARSIGSFLIKWGFLDQPVRARQLARYLAAISRAMTVAIFVERKRMVEENNGTSGR